MALSSRRSPKGCGAPRQLWSVISPVVWSIRLVPCTFWLLAIRLFVFLSYSSNAYALLIYFKWFYTFKSINLHFTQYFIIKYKFIKIFKNLLIYLLANFANECTLEIYLAICVHFHVVRCEPLTFIALDVTKRSQPLVSHLSSLGLLFQSVDCHLNLSLSARQLLYNWLGNFEWPRFYD